MLGIRPEHLLPAEPGTELSIEVNVAVTEPTGAETLLATRFGKNDVVVLVRDRIDIVAGSEITLRLLPQRLHFFDGLSGARIS